MTLQDFWTPSRWTRDYGWRPAPGEKNPYTLGYHIGQDIAGRTWLSGVPALRAGKVVRSGRSSVIGGYIVIEADEDGRYDGYAHLNTSPNSRPGVGQRVKRGDPVGKLARSTLPWAGDDYTGSGSDGPHLHFTISYKADNSWNPVRGYDLDPRPFIRSALSGPDWAGGTATPFEPEEEKFMPALSDDQQRELYWWVKQLGEALLNGRPEFGLQYRPVDIILKDASETRKLADEIRTRVRGEDPNLDALQVIQYQLRNK